MQFRECGYGWEDAASNRKHPRHRCDGDYMHKGMHMCGAWYTDENGTRVMCGAVERAR